MEYQHHAGQPTPPGVPAVQPDTPTPVDGSVNAITQMGQTLEDIQKQLADFKPPDPGESDERLTAVEKAVARVSPWKTLLGLVAFLVVGGIAVVSALRDYAQEAVIETVKEAHKADVEPSVATVQALKENIETTGRGVSSLLEQQTLDKKIKTVEIELTIHQDQHQGLLQEWSAKKAARRKAGDKPQKTPEHIRLEARLKSLAGG